MDRVAPVFRFFLYHTDCTSLDRKVMPRDGGRGRGVRSSLPGIGTFIGIDLNEVVSKGL